MKFTFKILERCSKSWRKSSVQLRTFGRGLSHEMLCSAVLFISSQFKRLTNHYRATTIFYRIPFYISKSNSYRLRLSRPQIEIEYTIHNSRGYLRDLGFKWLRAQISFPNSTNCPAPVRYLQRSFTRKKTKLISRREKLTQD